MKDGTAEAIGDLPSKLVLSCIARTFQRMNEALKFTTRVSVLVSTWQYTLWQTLHIVSMNISVHVKTNTKAFPFGPTVLSSRGASYSVGLLDNLCKIIFDMRWNCGRRAWISTSHCPLWYAVAGPGDLSPLEPFELDPALPIPSFGESQLMYPPMAHGAGYV